MTAIRPRSQQEPGLAGAAPRQIDWGPPLRSDLPAHLAASRMRVTKDLIDCYAALSQDYNPIHVDADFASQTEMGGIIAHGTLALNLIWQSMADSLGSAALKHFALEAQFVRPVRIDDVIVAGGLLEGDGSYRVWVRNDADSDVIRGVCALRESPCAERAD